MPRRTAVLLLGSWLAAAGPAAASHPKDDIVKLDKGDRFYGEIKKVTQGTLTLKTASAGTLSVKWSHVVRLVSTFQYQVQVTSGERYFGSLAEPDEEGHLKVVGSAGTHSLPLGDVFWLGPIERGFWREADRVGQLLLQLHREQRGGAVQPHCSERRARAVAPGLSELSEGCG